MGFNTQEAYDSTPPGEVLPGTQWDPFLKRYRLIDVGLYDSYCRNKAEEKRNAICDECHAATNGISVPVHRKGKLQGVLCIECGKNKEIHDKYYNKELI